MQELRPTTHKWNPRKRRASASKRVNYWNRQPVQRKKLFAALQRISVWTTQRTQRAKHQGNNTTGKRVDWGTEQKVPRRRTQWLVNTLERSRALGVKSAEVKHTKASITAQSEWPPGTQMTTNSIVDMGRGDACGHGEGVLIQCWGECKGVWHFGDQYGGF